MDSIRKTLNRRFIAPGLAVLGTTAGSVYGLGNLGARLAAEHGYLSRSAGHTSVVLPSGDRPASNNGFTPAQMPMVINIGGINTPVERLREQAGHYADALGAAVTVIDPGNQPVPGNMFKSEDITGAFFRRATQQPSLAVKRSLMTLLNAAAASDRPIVLIKESGGNLQGMPPLLAMPQAYPDTFQKIRDRLHVVTIASPVRQADQDRLTRLLKPGHVTTLLNPDDGVAQCASRPHVRTRITPDGRVVQDSRIWERAGLAPFTMGAYFATGGYRRCVEAFKTASQLRGNVADPHGADWYQPRVKQVLTRLKSKLFEPLTKSLPAKPRVARLNGQQAKR